MTLRCGWCQRFVAKGTPMTCWRVQVGLEQQQRPGDVWNYWARLLCPSCASAASISASWWQRVSIDDVRRLRPEVLA